jgi:hypothetical protein
MSLLGIAPLALACETKRGDSNGEDETDGGNQQECSWSDIAAVADRHA